MDNNARRMVREILSSDVFISVFKKEGDSDYSIICPDTVDAGLAREEYRNASVVKTVAAADVPEEVMCLLSKHEEYARINARIKKGAKFLFVSTDDTVSYEIVVYKQGEYYR